MKLIKTKIKDIFLVSDTENFDFELDDKSLVSSLDSKSDGVINLYHSDDKFFFKRQENPYVFKVDQCYLEILPSHIPLKILYLQYLKLFEQ